MAVATADPNATAPMAMALRRGERRIDCADESQEQVSGSRRGRCCEPANSLSAGITIWLAVDLGFERNRIAAALLADGRDVNSGGAVLADHVRAFLIIALAAANLGRRRRRRRWIDRAGGWR